MKKEELNVCVNVNHYCAYPSNADNCNCYVDYCLWCKDEPKMTWEEWLKEAERQYKERENAWRHSNLKKGVPGIKASGGTPGQAGSWRCG